MTNEELFDTAYAQTHRAADRLTNLASAERPVMRADTRELVRLLTSALCAAQELDNRITRKEMK